ncbi:MAG: hypothetical protein WC742_15230 [Gallionellaceae bacterium]|jgi:hypothetical protein
MRKIFVLISLVLMLAACGEGSKNKEDIRSNLKDSGVAKEIISFKGIPLGKSNAKSSLLKLCEEEKLETDCSRSSEKLLTTFGKLEVYWGKGGERLEKLHGKIIPTFTLNSNDEIDLIQLYGIKTNSILETISLLIEKYGKPESKTQHVQNRFGSTFEQKFFKWIDAQGNTLQVWSINEKIDEGFIIFRSAAEEARVIEKEKQSEKTAKENL